MAEFHIQNILSLICEMDFGCIQKENPKRFLNEFTCITEVLTRWNYRYMLQNCLQSIYV